MLQKTIVPVALVLLASSAATADPCRIESSAELSIVRSLIVPGETIVEFCWFCDQAVPTPLRVGKVVFEHHAPEALRIWNSQESFTLADLNQAEREGTGPLAEVLRKDIDQEYADSYAHSDPHYQKDPYIVEEKRKAFAMRLEFVRQDYELRVWDSLLINGMPADPRLLYVPTGGNRYASVGLQIDCLMDDAPEHVTYVPIVRSPETERPPVPYIADVTGQCYDGSCPLPRWTVHQATPTYDSADGSTATGKGLAVGEEVEPIQVLSYVRRGAGEVYRDKGRFFAGDRFYLLDSQAEGFYRFWHYGDVFVSDSNELRVVGDGAPCQDDGEHWGCVREYPQEVWWALVRRSDGAELWLREPAKTLSGVLVD